MPDAPPPPVLIDTHAHLASPRFADDLDRVIADAHAAGVAVLVAIGTNAVDSLAVVELARREPSVHAVVGIHPNDSADASAVDWEAIVRLATDPRVVGLGETGLDRHWDRAPFATQQDFFGRHLDLAGGRDLAVVIHSRDCQRDVIDQIARMGRPVRGVQHSFTGTWEEAQALLELGLHLSFAGMITFRNKTLDPLREVAARVPADRFLVETDCPYLTPHPFRGKRNEPARVALVAEALAEIRGVSIEEVAADSTRNARHLFGL